MMNGWGKSWSYSWGTSWGHFVVAAVRTITKMPSRYLTFPRFKLGRR